MSDQETTESTESGAPTIESLQRQIVAMNNRTEEMAARYESRIRNQRNSLDRMMETIQQLRRDNYAMKQQGLAFKPERGKW